jgi:hypothetical protein
VAVTEGAAEHRGVVEARRLADLLDGAPPLRRRQQAARLGPPLGLDGGRDAADGSNSR